MTIASNRRGFFGLLVEEAFRGARQAAPLMPLPISAAARRLPEPREKIREQSHTTPAPPTDRCMGRPELDQLIEKFGLGAHRAEVQGHAMISYRLTAASHGNSYLAAGAAPVGEVPDVGTQAPRMRLLAEVDLTDIPTACRREAELPEAGSLQLYWTLGDVPAGSGVRAASSSAVQFRSGHTGSRGRRNQSIKPPGSHPVHVSGELSLPRVWSERVARLGLTAEEAAAWEKLRMEIAARQGIVPFDQIPTSERPAIHRLLGYPDERQGSMPLICEAAARGIELADLTAHSHPQVTELEEASGRWRMLFQLSADEMYAWRWGSGRKRLYLWIDCDDLRRQDFSRVWAIPQ